MLLAHLLAPALLAAVAPPQPAPAATAVVLHAGPVTRAAPTEPARVEIAVKDDQLTLIGSFWAAKDPKKPAPAVLLVHDAGGKRGDLAEVADKLQGKGFAVLAVDLRGHGDSVGAGKAWADVADADKAAQWVATLRDVKASLVWLGSQTGVQKTNLALFGDRAGSALAARQASKDENVRSVVLLDPPATAFNFDLGREIESLAGVPTMIAVTKEDKSKAESLAQSAQKSDDGMRLIEIAVFKGVSLAPVIDKKLPADIANFLWAKANPKKGAE